MEFKKNVKVVTDDFYYDLFDGGYIKPEKILQNKLDQEQVKQAIDIIKRFKDEMESQEIIEHA